ncbi:DUF7144 family membrane protein [Jatrophihabitans sp. DSM 45814]
MTGGAAVDARSEGWLAFAAIALITTGVMRFFDAAWAFRYDGALPDQLEGAVFGHRLTTYGWVYLIVAFLLIVCGLSVGTGSQIARWAGVAAGAITCISAIWLMPYYPVWSLTYILLGVAVIYALTAHGDRSEDV